MRSRNQSVHVYEFLTMASHRKSKKNNRKRRHYALLILLVLSTFLITLWSYIQLPRVYASYVYDPSASPLLAVTMQGIHDGVYPWSGTGADDDEPDGDIGMDTAMDPDIDQDIDTVTVDGLETDEVTAEGPEIEAVIDGDQETDAVVDEDQDIDADVAEDQEMTDTHEETEAAPDDTRLTYHGPVDDDYFNDALFVGDSRMVGLSEYCEPLDTRADFYVKKALTIYNLLDGKPIRSFDGTQKSLWEVLDEKQYGKIYIMVGINEIGVGNSEYFKDAYEQVVDRIREVQPDALIFINSIMHVSQAKSDTDSLYNNTNINARNDAIASIADNIHIYYLNINEAVDDENGALRSDITFDDIHLKGSCYEPWYEYLLAHGVK